LLDTLENMTEQSPDQHLVDNSLRQEIARSLATLTARESDVIIYYYGLNGTKPMTLEEIGDKFSLTRERVRQIKEKATRRLRNSHRSRLLKSYLA